MTEEIKDVSSGSVDAANKRAWEQAIWEKNRGKCSNCGSDDKVRVKMVVPTEAGGKYVDTNGVLLCRTCELVTEATKPYAREKRRPVNFWVSRELYDRLNNGLRTRNGFTSMGGMVRYLMTKYVTDVERFDDLDLYQDSRASDVKINVWVESDRYETFKVLVDRQGKTVTDVLKALIRMFECQAEPLIRSR